jgi:hypothetical protein
MLVLEQYGFHNLSIGKRYAELVFLHPVGPVQFSQKLGPDTLR